MESIVIEAGSYYVSKNKAYPERYFVMHLCKLMQDNRAYKGVVFRSETDGQVYSQQINNFDNEYEACEK